MSETKTNWHALQDALDNNDLAKVKAAAGSDIANTRRYYDACLWAIKYGRDGVLDALLAAAGGFNFDRKKNDFAITLPFRDKSADRIANRGAAVNLINEAYVSPNAEATLLTLYKYRNKGSLYDFKPLETGDFVTEEAPVTLLKACLESEPYAFGICLEKAGMASTEKLTFIMSYATEKHLQLLGKQLLALAQRGEADDVEKVMLLLANNLSSRYPHYKESLLNTVARKDRGMLSLLLSRAPLDQCGEALVKEVRKIKTADAEIVHTVEVAVERALLTKAKTPGAKPPAPRVTAKQFFVKKPFGAI